MANIKQSKDSEMSNEHTKADSFQTEREAFWTNVDIKQKKCPGDDSEHLGTKFRVTSGTDVVVLYVAEEKTVAKHKLTCIISSNEIPRNRCIF
jgi:hypothetical protein